MSMPFSFGDGDQGWALQEGLAELFDEESPLQGLLEGNTHGHDHLSLSMPLNHAQTMTNACPRQPDQPFTPSPQPFIKCIDHSEVRGDSVKGGAHVPKRRVRGPDWSDEEKRHYLTLKEEALGSVKGKDWEFISQNLEKRHGIRRSAKCCEDLWGTLRRAFKHICSHESNRKNDHVRYWEMDADGRAGNGLPKSFPEDNFTMMESILAAQELQRSGKNSKVSNSTKTPANESDDNWNNIQRGKRLEDLQIKQQANSALQCLSESLGHVIGDVVDALLTSLSDALTSAVEPDIEANLETELMKKWMMDAINSSFVRPVASDVREVRRLPELEDEARMETIQKERRALDLEELQIFKRQRLGRVRSKRLGTRRGSVTSVAEGTEIGR